VSARRQGPNFYDENDSALSSAATPSASVARAAARDRAQRPSGCARPAAARRVRGRGGERLAGAPAAVGRDFATRVRDALNAALLTRGLGSLPGGDLERGLAALPPNVVLVLDRAEQAEYLRDAVQPVLETLARWAQAAPAARLVLATRVDAGNVPRL
jgi:hypothetical protein